MAVLNRNRFGRFMEKLKAGEQIAFMEVDGKIVYFNEAEAVAALEEENREPESPRTRPRRGKGKREEDFRDFLVVSIDHKMTDEELTAEFGNHGWEQLSDEIYRRHRFMPAKVEVEEHGGLDDSLCGEVSVSTVRLPA